ncbi:kinase-like protein [Thelephora ganbajun]|uniref:Kinase-like protein n=1 Tax=Thelephora ganbajun TaxID=370292 RepID=A0ACB6Z3L1_THEGA|nr:kinase-like protein [Thelephora ganbajun]
MWKYLEHPNILSLRGVTMNPPRLISDWMPNGNLSNYIGNNANADRLGLISDIVEGFKYLHSRDVIHGDIKGLNILVDNPVRARIADFGISIVTRNDNSLRPATDQSMIFTLRWAAPEVLQGGNPSKKSDVYSFAMVMIEVFTGAFPFNGRELPVTAAAIIGGERPPLVGHATFTPNLQELTQNCWRQDADERPEMSEIAQVLANIIH